MTHASSFRTPEGEAAYLAAYETVLRSWPVPCEEMQIRGRFGTTHAVVSGPKNAPPLVLLHGFVTTLLIWSPNVADVSKDYWVYAIDVMGHPNKSIPDPRAPIRSPADFVTWLGETLDELDLGEVSLMGLSYGAWIGLQFALAAPGRVRKLVLLSPAASLLPLVKQFNLRLFLSMLPPRRHWFLSFMGWMGPRGAPGDGGLGDLVDLLYLGVSHFRMRPETMRVMPGVFSDEDLSALSMPVLLLMGEHEVIYDSNEALTRARRLIPDLKGELVPHSSHDMSYNQNRIVDARVLEFLGSERRDSDGRR
jgi:pimeloyl-ACP methyl ester carboxylesterase